MINLTEPFIDSLGTEPFEVLGFESEEELEAVLLVLMSQKNKL